MKTVVPSRLLAATFILVSLVAPLMATGVQEQEEENAPIVVGISKFVSHPALDAVEQGIIDELAELGYENIRYDLQNATADITTARQIASKFRSDEVDIAVGIATPVAQALKQGLDGTPVIYTAITDPVSAGLVESLEVGEPGIAGVSHRTPVEGQIEFFMAIQEIDSLGHVYSGGETNAVFLASETEAAAEALGIDFVSQTISTPAEVRQAAQSIVNRVDAFYVSTDNQVVSALSSLTEVATRAGVPVISADPSSALENPVLIAWGFDWYAIGRRTGELIDEVLQGEATQNIPTVLFDDPAEMEMLLNLDVAEELGIAIPSRVTEMADRIIEEGEIQE
ncbi:MAG: ABC transporter substrate-binding protein [Alkalispirochaetaceae bacterium]